MSLLSIQGLRVSTADKEIIKGIDLEVDSGEIHAIMGPNGSGKSTLANTLMGHPAYAVDGGSVEFQGEDLLALEPDERSRLGMFLAFQYPKEISGVTLRNFLFAAHKAQKEARGEKAMTVLEFQRSLEDAMQKLKMHTAFADRFINQGFSGGEKKKAEILQLHMLEPALALLDETDSGLDVDALKIVAEGVRAKRSDDFSAIIVTHYARILEYVEPTHVHVMVAGEIRESGDMSLAHTLEKEGYARYGVAETPTGAITLD